MAKETVALFDSGGKKVNYDSVSEKKARLQDYQVSVRRDLSGEFASVPISALISDLRDKAGWIKNHLNNNEWVEQGETERCRIKLFW